MILEYKYFPNETISSINLRVEVREALTLILDEEGEFSHLSIYFKKLKNKNILF